MDAELMQLMNDLERERQAKQHQATQAEARQPLYVDYLVGVDLGQSDDYTAITVTERSYLPGIKKPIYRLTDVDRIRGVKYPQIIKALGVVINTPPIKDNCIVIVDYTGVGRPVVDYMDVEKISPIIAVTITGGDRMGEDPDDPRHFTVPKRDLVNSLLVSFQSSRYFASRKTEKFLAFVKEAQGFKMKISKKGHDSYEAWREGEHDDMILSGALACWYGERFG